MGQGVTVRVAGSRGGGEDDDRLGPGAPVQHVIAEPGAAHVAVAAQHLAPAIDHLHVAGVYLLDNLGGGPVLALELMAGEIDKAPVGFKTAPMTVNPLGEHIGGNGGHQGRDSVQIVGQGLRLALIPEVEGRKLLQQSVIEHGQPP